MAKIYWAWLQLKLKRRSKSGWKYFHTEIKDDIDDIVVIFSSWSLLAAKLLISYVIDCANAMHDSIIENSIINYVIKNPNDGVVATQILSLGSIH